MFSDQKLMNSTKLLYEGKVSEVIYTIEDLKQSPLVQQEHVTLKMYKKKKSHLPPSYTATKLRLHSLEFAIS